MVHTVAGTNAAAARLACKPILAMRAPQVMRGPGLPVLPWTWRATIAADAMFCANATSSFEIDFIRAKEKSTDLQFTEKFNWRRGNFEGTVELSPEEDVLAYRIGFIASCVCRELAEQVNGAD
jgi:hypothetical protein